MPNNDYLELHSLYHHGIKGMRWGVRRFQNEDGTLTEAGKARYNADLTKKDPDRMTDAELDKAANRIQKENRYRELTGTTQPRKIMNRDTLIKLGATFVATGAATFLFRKYFGKDGSWLPKRDAQGKFLSRKRAMGKAMATAALAGGIGALTVGATSLGGSVAPEAKQHKD